MPPLGNFPFFGGDDDDEDVEESGEESSESPDSNPLQGVPQGRHARSLEDFGVTANESIVEHGRELSIHASDGEVYAGSWPREMFENARRNPTQPTWIGYEESRNLTKGASEVSIMHEDLNTHMAVFGASGNGKSTLLLNMMMQWAYAGFGFCFIDPKGDDSKKLMQMLPEDRLDDVYWVEPGSVEHEKVIGINFLHTHADPGDPNFDTEASQVEGDLVDILFSSRSGQGARMESIIKNIIRRMLADDANYSILDMYKLLSNSKYREELPKYYQDEPNLLPQAEQIANKEADDMDALLRRLQDFAEQQSLREAVAHRESDIDIMDLINNDKIIILRMRSQMADDLVRVVATSVMRRVFAAVAARDEAARQNPYFLVADEFHRLKGGANNVEKMLSIGRSSGLSVTMATQQPSQLDDLKNSLGNIKNFISFDPGEIKDARFISTRLGTDAQNLMNLDRYKVYCNVRVDGDKQSGPVRTDTFAPYPPLRTKEEANQVIEDIVKEHGKEPLRQNVSGQEDLHSHPLARTTSDGEADQEASDDIIVTDDNDTLTEQELLECIFDGQLHSNQNAADAPDGWTGMESITEQIALKLGKNLDEDYGAKTARAVTERLHGGYIDTDVRDGDMYVSLTPSGHDRVFSIDSGQSGSAGKAKHRVILEKTYLVLRQLGYDVEIPRQDGRMPDGVAVPRINPNDADTVRAMQEKNMDLETTYPRLYELFGPDELNIEAESSSITKMKQVFKNLVKAMEKQRRCVFAVAEGETEFEANARRIEEAIRDRRFARAFDGGDRHFYNFSNSFNLKDNSDAVPCIENPGANQEWWDNGDRIVLKDPGGGSPLVEFHDATDFASAKTGDFPYYYVRDNSKGVTTLYRGNGKKISEYANKKAIENDGFKQVKKPFVPEVELPEWPLNDTWDDDAYSIIVFPDLDNEDTSPQLYKNGECRPLFTDEDEIHKVNTVSTEVSPEQLKETDGTTETTDKTSEPTEPEESDDIDEIDKTIAENAHESNVQVTDKRGDDSDESESTGTQDTEEVPVSDGTKPKSTNDVVKESDETWSKPEEGDDDYNPAKDNTNYRTGYDEERTDADWTGGDARDADENGDFDDYEIPDSGNPYAENEDEQDGSDDDGGFYDPAEEGALPPETTRERTEDPVDPEQKSTEESNQEPDDESTEESEDESTEESSTDKEEDSETEEESNGEEENEEDDEGSDGYYMDPL